MLLALWLGCELALWLASDAPDRAEGRCALLVLGFPSRPDGTPHPVQRQRMEAAAEAVRRAGCERVVLSGGAVANGHVEARTMRRIGLGLGLDPARVVLEESARSTWENVENSLPLLRGFERVVVVSDPLHARRGRRYLCRQDPVLCERAGIAAAHRPFVHPLWTVGSALYELRAWARDASRDASRDAPDAPADGSG